jgi:hypothetical protein
MRAFGRIVCGVLGSSVVIAFAPPASAAQIAQTITFLQPGNVPTGEAFYHFATASSNLLVTVTSLSPGVCTVSGPVVTAGATPGTCILDADQAGDATFLPAPTVTVLFTVFDHNDAAAGQLALLGTDSSWRVTPVDPGMTGWNTNVGFNDSAWQMASTFGGLLPILGRPFFAQQVWSSGGPNSTTETVAWFRRVLSLAQVPTQAWMDMGVDDDVDLFINGVEVRNDTNGVANNMSLDLVPYLIPGNNLFAFVVRDNIAHGFQHGAWFQVRSNVGTTIDPTIMVANSPDTCSPLNTDGTPNLAAANHIATANSFTLSNGSTYVINGALDVLRLLYGGLDHNGNFDCNGDIRRSLIKSWNNLYGSACAVGSTTCPTSTNLNTPAVHHVLRLSDNDPATAAFVQLVGFGSRRLGANPFVPGAVLNKGQNPFCNSQDANEATAPMCSPTAPCFRGIGIGPQATSGYFCSTGASGTCTFSDGGQSDMSDLDQIRVNCQAGDMVCGVDGKAGLVQVVFPSDNPTNSLAESYPTQSCDPGSCDLVAPATNAQLSQAPCPDGQPQALGRCWHPKHTDPGTGAVTFQCLAARTHHCFGALGDGRAYNKVVIRPNAAAGRPGEFAVDVNGRRMLNSFFRLRAEGCRNTLDPTRQASCLAGVEPCSLGYTGPGGIVTSPLNPGGLLPEGNAVVF